MGDGAARTSRLDIAVSVAAVLMAGFHLLSTQVVLLSHWPQLNLHLAFGLVIVFMQKAEASKRTRVIWFLAVVVSLIITAYIHVESDSLLDREQMPTDIDFIVGIALLVVVITSAYISFGAILPAMALIGIAYSLLGPYFPGPLFHAGMSFKRMVAMMTTDLGGIYGTLLFISATYMAVFLTLGSFIENSGAAQFFVDLPLSLFRGVKAGGGYAAVLASALMGMGSGSPVANVVTTGTFTIPLMKRSGFMAHVAGGIEAAASTGGQLMPPVMGAVAFLVADFTGVSYVEVIGRATIPAVLFFTSVGMGVYFRTSRMNLLPLPADELPKLVEVLKRSEYILPILILIVILAADYTPSLAAFWAVISLVLLILIRQPLRSSVGTVWNCLAFGGRRAAEFATGMACIAIFVKAIMATGIGLKLPLMIGDYAGGSLLFGYVLTALASAVLGMGLPTVAAYIVVAVLGVPALVQMGAHEMQAHFFVLYFSILSGLTPPVALAALAAAKVATSDYVKTSIASLKFGMVAFIVPFLFAFNPTLLSIGSLSGIATASLVTLAGCFALSAFFEGYLFRRTSFLERILLGVASVGFFDFVVRRQVLSVVTAVACVAGVALWQRSRMAAVISEAGGRGYAPLPRD